MSVIKSKFKDVEIPQDQSFVGLLRHVSKLYTEKIALIDYESGRRCTYGDLLKSVEQIGANLFHKGFCKGDIVLYTCTNSIDCLLLNYGLLSIGVVVSAINPDSTPSELLYAMKHCQPKYVITQQHHIKKLSKAANSTDSVQEIFVSDGIYKGYRSLCTSKNHQFTFPDVNINPKEDIAYILLSSGTSGLPKGVLLSHYSFVSAASIFGQSVQRFITPEDKVMSPFPMFHTGGISLVYFTLSLGATYVFAHKYVLPTFLKIIEKERITVILLHPPAMKQISLHSLQHQVDLSSVQVVSCGAACIKKTLSESMEKCFPKLQRIVQIYGMTECSIGCIMAPAQGWKHGALGCVSQNCEVKICDVEDSKLLQSGESGQIYIKTPSMMKGYLNNPLATTEVLASDGWLATGDIGYVDDDGHLYIVDRFKELIKYHQDGLTFSVAPAEIEALLINHPSIKEAAVIGVKDEEFGELPKAYVILKDNQLTEKQVLSYVKDNVSDFKRLRGGVKFVDTIPKTQSGKILRRLLREEANQNR